jgi:D-alanyl-D-alanine carboxypeptidase
VLRRRWLALLTVIALVAMAPAVRAAGAPPACTYGDVLTTYRTTSDWYRSLLDTRWRLTAGYAPSDLVPVTTAGISGSGLVRRAVIPDLAALAAAARAAGAPLAVQSAYRSYSQQVATFDSWVRQLGYSSAVLASARPGHSEHQLGVTLDLRSYGGPAPWNLADWGTTAAGRWLAQNAWTYGFVMSYPKAPSPALTCYKYEPWHFRWFGRRIAAAIRASGQPPRSWLWARGAISGGWTGGTPTAPAPTPTPSPTPTPTPTPTPKPLAPGSYRPAPTVLPAP